MKTLLLRKIFNFSSVVGLLVFITAQTNAQDLKTTHNDAPQRGHALYKQSKIYDSKTGPVGVKPKAVGDRAMDRWLYEQRQLQDPFTKEIPKSIKLMEAKFSEKIETRNLEREASKKSGDVAAKSKFSYWKNRGPGNVGGRTRALALDRNNENIIFAGGVSGGLWRSTNAGQSWQKVTRQYQSPSITAIVQDPRKRKGHIWYYASGERFGNSASGGGAFYQGTGVYKSVNNGRSWFLLKDSNDNDVTSFSSFDLINSLAVDPKNGDLYVATFDGVYRSKNGGKDFEEVLPSGFDSNTEVIITPSGKIYATVDIFGGGNAGFYVSDDGDTWTNITPEGIFPAYGRTVMDYDPSDDNRVYFFSYDASRITAGYLWRYQADAATPEERWADLSANLPINVGGIAGNLNLQGSYNMVIKVHPTNPDLVFLGGTNLYRSTTGFTTPTGFESWIGGYTIFANNYGLYPNHHPDQHNLVFLPSDPNRAISGNDGGVQLTEDITVTDEPVTWISLNNGYITTQPYAISFDPEASNDDLLAGFQDNGTWFTNSTNVNDPWISDFGGDGSFNAIADGGLTRYVSSQFGNLYRFNFNEAGDFISFTRVRPAGASGFDFVAPFVLDPNNDNIMYMPAGDRIWRNNDLDEIPLFSNAPATVNWVEQTQTATPDGSFISALDVSKFPVANRLYYGTSTGGVYRVGNANLDNQEVVDISTGKGLPQGNINNIYVDPSNSDRVFVVFSNYNIPSLFMSENAGDTWTNISGNLEENVDGTGNGPSVRWFAINGRNDGYFVGTSTGLYFTYFLKGNKTRWFREPIRIGNNVITQVRTRKDGFVAAAAHGNGIYSANFYVRPRPEPTLSVAYLLKDLTLPINSENVEVDVTDLFVSSKGRKIDIELTNTNPNLVNATLQGDKLTLSIAPDAEGMASIGLIATSGKEKVSEGFTVNVMEAAIYQQIGPVVSSSPSQFFTDFGGLSQSADDFIVPEGSKWKIKSILAFGAANYNPELTDATVVIYTNNNGVPGQEIYNSGSIAPISESTDTNLNLELPAEVELESGSYWLSVYVNLAFAPDFTQWFWATQGSVIGNEAAFKDNLDLFGTGALDWTPQSVAFGISPEDQVFQIFGEAQELGISTNQAVEASTTLNKDLQSLIIVDANVVTTVWPNPSSSEFFFSLRDNKDEKVTTKIYNILGQMVYEKTNLDSKQSFSWDASNSPAGIYLVKILGANTNKSFKIVKN